VGSLESPLSTTGVILWKFADLGYKSSLVAKNEFLEPWTKNKGILNFLIVSYIESYGYFTFTFEQLEPNQQFCSFPENWELKFKLY
jgi:hypothetical protein